MSYSRLPLAMARDGLLPPVFARLTGRMRAPWVSILVLSAGWALCLGLGFERLVTLDIMIYGASLMLEFAALVALRVREPALHRPFRVPGGIVGAACLGIPPAVLLVLSIVHAERETILNVSAPTVGLGLIGAGVVAYAINQRLRPAGWVVAPERDDLVA
jgi:amino acid transporter